MARKSIAEQRQQAELLYAAELLRIRRMKTTRALRAYLFWRAMRRRNRRLLRAGL